MGGYERLEQPALQQREDSPVLVDAPGPGTLTLASSFCARDARGARGARLSWLGAMKARCSCRGKTPGLLFFFVLRGPGSGPAAAKGVVTLLLPACAGAVSVTNTACAGTVPVTDTARARADRTPQRGGAGAE